MVVPVHEGMPQGHLCLSGEEEAGIVIGDRVNVKQSKYPPPSCGILAGMARLVAVASSGKGYAVDVFLPKVG